MKRWRREKNRLEKSKIENEMKVQLENGKKVSLRIGSIIRIRKWNKSSLNWKKILLENRKKLDV